MGSGKGEKKKTHFPPFSCCQMKKEKETWPGQERRGGQKNQRKLLQLRALLKIIGDPFETVLQSIQSIDTFLSCKF